MKHFLAFLILFFFISAVSAQSNLFLSDSNLVKADSINKKASESIVDRINKVEPGKGIVKIIQDDSVSDRIGKPGVENNHANSGSYVEVSGYRIQVFSGNNQRVSKNEAFRKEADIKSVYPELGTYVLYNAPFWRLRVGDFQTFQDARNMLLKLRNSFPTFGREMSILKEKIQVRQD
jgi:hypothetical protein